MMRSIWWRTALVLFAVLAVGSYIVIGVIYIWKLGTAGLLFWLPELLILVGAALWRFLRSEN